jgi:hypothetical protein
MEMNIGNTFSLNDEYIRDKYKTAKIDFIQGHIKTIGRTSNQEKNPLWKIQNENGTTIIVMYCEVDTLCILCPTSYQKILDYEKTNNKGNKITWYKMSNGYISCHLNIHMHQVITGCMGNGKGTNTISVDHVDRNPLNNCFDNLRIATREEQQKNSKGTADDGTKRERKYNAINLPDGITQDMMKKYVVYYHEWLDKEHTKKREFFKVEKHAKLQKPWISSKSSKISLVDKLLSANKIVTDLESDIYP